MAQKRVSARDHLVATIDALLGHTAAPGLPLAGVWAEYERLMRTEGKRIEPRTERQRRRICFRFADWAKTNWPRAEDAEHVDRQCAVAFGEHLAHDGLTGKTRQNLLGDLSVVWNGLRCTRDSITENPWTLVRPNTDDSERGTPFSPEDERATLSAAETAGHGWWLACMIARHTGLRYGDVARLEWSQVDLDTAVIRAAPSKTKRYGIAIVIPMSAQLLSAMRARRALDPAQRWVLPEHAECYPRPERGAPRAFSAAVLKPAGLCGKGYTFHSWRHTLRTRMSEAGVSDELARRMLGHQNEKTSMRYDHALRTDELREAVESAASCGWITRAP
jgi:integrase